MSHRKPQIFDLAANILGKIEDSLVKIINIIKKNILSLNLFILILENQFSVVSIPFFPTDNAVQISTAVLSGITLYYVLPKYCFSPTIPFYIIYNVIRNS